ncbi:hypothetical protein ACFOPX_01725 [Helicobacter baculiformis]|uniref:Phage-Barnase-EndoU-ColicinE5/D-RelE like nuclease 3 domain-containing protein n=1 Tax=Helicobacter baculiformis TaxID=427351 RepID=A0ABV7ZG56_9HELI
MRALGQRVEFDNATRALIREIEGSIPPDDGGGGGGLVPPKGDSPQGDLPPKSKLTQDLNPQQIKAHIEQWDLSNPKATDRLLIGKVQGEELEQLKSEFNFKGNYTLAREIDAKHVAHVMHRHSSAKIEEPRNQIPITLEDISNYPNIVKNADVREVAGGRIRYKKQINGHYVVVEEALTGQNKLRFVTMWKKKIKHYVTPIYDVKGYSIANELTISLLGYYAWRCEETRWSTSKDIFVYWWF